MIHIYKMDNTESLYDEDGTQSQAPERDDSIRSSQTIQRLLPREYNQQITTNRETNTESPEGEGEIDMTAQRKNEAKKDIDLFNFIKDHRKYKNEWDVKKTANTFIQKVLDVTSKEKTGKRGEPDLIYVNESKRLLILVENKDTINQHQSKEGNNTKDYAVDGIKHYLSFFTKEGLKQFSEPIQKYLSQWCVIGIAVSGNINDEYSHRISTFVIQGSDLKDIETGEILDESDYVSLFENIDMEKVVREISESSRRINSLLRSLDSQKRPVLLSGLMICLFTRNEGKNDFKDNYIRWETKTIITNIPTTITDILTHEGIPADKVKVLQRFRK